jgi:hypothetical protein
VLVTCVIVVLPVAAPLAILAIIIDFHVVVVDRVLGFLGRLIDALKVWHDAADRKKEGA